MNERTPLAPAMPPDALPSPVGVTASADASAETPKTPERARLDPTRYGDWELNGKCVDF